MVTDQLPPAVVESWEWQAHANCRGRPDLFFADEGERGDRRNRRLIRAKRVCDSCPVRMQCQQHALTVGEPYGVWGGLSEHERGIPKTARP